MQISVKPDYDWQAFDSPNPVQRWWKRRIAEIVRDWVSEVRGAPVIVDVGCGSSPLSTCFPNVLGIDRDAEKVAFMNAREVTAVRGNVYVRGDIVAGLPLTDGSADVVLAIELAEHVQAKAFWPEISRIAKPGAMVIVATPDYSSPIWQAVEKIYKRLHPGQYCDDHTTHYTAPKLNFLGEFHDLQLQELRYVARADMVARFVRQ